MLQKRLDILKTKLYKHGEFRYTSVLHEHVFNQFNDKTKYGFRLHANGDMTIFLQPVYKYQLLEITKLDNNAKSRQFLTR